MKNDINKNMEMMKKIIEEKKANSANQKILREHQFTVHKVEHQVAKGYMVNMHKARIKIIIIKMLRNIGNVYMRAVPILAQPFCCKK